MVITASGLQIFMPPVGVGVPKLDPEKSKWVVATPSGLQVLLASLVGVRVHKLDPKKSQSLVSTPSGLHVFMSFVGVRVPKLDP